MLRVPLCTLLPLLALLPLLGAAHGVYAVLTWKSLSVEATVLSQEVTCPLP